MGLRAGLGKCGKFHPHLDSIPGPSSPQAVAIQTELPGPQENIVRVGNLFEIKCLNRHPKKMRDSMVMSNVMKTVLCLDGIPQSEVMIKLLELWLLPLVLSFITTDVF